jgi:hypothetical protein
MRSFSASFMGKRLSSLCTDVKEMFENGLGKSARLQKLAIFRFSGFVARRKFFTEIVTCRIAKSLDLKWLEDITNRPNGTAPQLPPISNYGQKHFLFQAGPLLVPSDPVTSLCMTEDAAKLSAEHYCGSLVLVCQSRALQPTSRFCAEACLSSSCLTSRNASCF